jgi:3-phytase
VGFLSPSSLRHWLAAAALLALVGCRGPGPLPVSNSDRVVSEVYQSSLYPGDDIDSLAIWQGTKDDHWLIATAKATHRLFVFDASTGELLETVGRRGSGKTEFERPNGVAVWGELLLVVERDNKRLQVLNLPDFTHVGFIGVGNLRRPYGITVTDGPEVFVTDNYDAPDESSALDEDLGVRLGERVRRYRLDSKGDGDVLAADTSSFGESEGEGVLWKVESIAADPELNRLLVAEELEKVIKVYTLDGGFTGQWMGSGVFQYEPEGIVLLRCGGEGFWIAVDQEKSRSYFRVFDRRSMNYVGTFTGKSTANTDGIAWTSRPFPGFPSGALFAVHDDSAVSAFDWRDISSALDLHCPGLEN